MTLGIIAILLISIVQLLCLFALVDQYKSILQLRDALRLVDTPQELSLVDLEGVWPSAVGLPVPLDSERFAVVLLLSTKCTTCTAVARGLGGRVQAPLWAVIAAGSERQGEQFQEEVGLTGERVLVDVGDESPRT